MSADARNPSSIRMPSLRRSCIVLSVVFAVMAAAFVLAHDFIYCSEEAYAETNSPSALIAKARGIWIVSLQAVPSEIHLPSRTVRVDSAWLEHRSHQSERFLEASEQRMDGLSLCFTISRDSIGDYFFVAGDDGASVDRLCWSPSACVYAINLDDAAAVQNLRLSLVSSFDAPRSKDIRFVPGR